MAESDALSQAVLHSIRHSFTTYKGLADRALAQLAPSDWLVVPGPEGNSPAVLLQHMIGNLRSRFTDFWTTDGEKPDRQRDQEFEQPVTINPPALLAQWEAAWQVLFDLLAAMPPGQLLHPVTIRGEAYTALGALQRQVAHYAYHTGQLVQTAKTLRGTQWQSLSIPRGQSAQFNQQMQANRPA
ncbi:DUF1572 domain-containing protein [Hymenobacter lutimineralis]|uniref:DUF1572 domain-containing protein n=1 Tax=Hymenobacter lutimineralis TaxID=2606448 RepID=A0A5D6UVZ6_9BACT|nr:MULTISPECIES: DUF1572 family protein [Hymenobacter]QIX60483.1 DUF1572 family protein [Hymenobacter sp. BT18]TYZ06564.1 DUF1572 domain-containing protein [Hymenobacter lutimineralis]